jgi:phenol/toluene 2-monooxygenase (NADH) P0/A0
MVCAKFDRLIKGVCAVSAISGSEETPVTASETAAEQLPRFVRLLQETANGLMVFEFSVGWPDMSVELVLPRPAFEAFCEKNKVQFLTEAVSEPGNINALVHEETE